MPIPQTVLDLIHRFDENFSAYRSGEYNEAQVREEFITPFFAALGWDVYNQQGASERFKPVVHEAAVRVGGATKAPDYAFRIGGQRVFFVEAKKPAVALKDDPAPAYQLRRYAWSGKLALSLLTNFAEFAVYDCRDKPAQTDRASTGRVFYCTYREYPEHWAYLAGIFAPEAIIKGGFDRFAEATRGKRGTAEVDAAFLAEIEGWRDVLARNLALRNPGLSARELNHAVQQTIDRIIFLRIAEDRGIEPYQRLLDAAQGAGIYPRLGELFRQADNRYNSGLFYFQPEKGREETPDTFTLGLTIDDKVLKGILQSLYYPASPYQFDMLPADILGQVYEQFLGRVIRLTPAGHAKVEEKPEVKKAGGVYYTPTYIVDYIVQHAVGPLLEGKTPAQVRGSARVAPLRVLDPACGSGTFLIQAYQYLLDWYLERYVEAGPDSHPSQVIPDLRGGWRLTAAERKAILLRHIYGVDIDAQAVEVTKLSLLLKVLEGESEATLGAQLPMSIAAQDRVLPDLSRNIRCGNSLIGPDYYQGEQLSLGLLDEDTLYRINAFDWEEGFHPAMMAGGFDAVIGNPPYIQSREGRVTNEEKEYYTDHFSTTEYQVNTYGLFLERGIELLKSEGLLGMIIPNYWLSTRFDRQLRHLLFGKNEVVQLLNVYQVFNTATVDTLIVTVKRPKKNGFPKQFTVLSIARELHSISDRLLAVHEQKWAFQRVYFVEDASQDIQVSFFDKIELNAENSIGGYFSSHFGMKPYQVGKGNPPQTEKIKNGQVFDAKEKIDDTYKPLLRARSIHRYYLEWEHDWIKYGVHLAEPRNPEIFLGPRILLRRIIGERLIGCYTEETFICNTDVITLKPLPNVNNMPDIRFFVGILLSKLCISYLKSHNINLDRAVYPKINTQTLNTYPTPNLNLSAPADVARHDRLVALVERMLELHRQLPAAKTPQATRLLQQQVDLTDKAIDALVYELYGLTAEEIEIVEG